MLLLKVTMLEGRTTEQRATLIRRLTEAAARHFDYPSSEIRVVIYEVAREAWGSGGQTIAEREGGSGDAQRR